MKTRNDLDRLLVTFLDDGETELPESALQSVRAGIDRTRQRVVIGPWREPAMPNLTRTVAVLAAAVVILAIGVFSLSGLPVATSGPPSVAAPPTPSTAPSATSAAESPAIPAYPAYRWPQALAPGDYSTSMAWDLPFEIRFTVPAGWESRDVEVVKGPAFVSVQVVRNTFADPCLGIEADPAVGPGVDDLAAALVLDNPAIVATQATPVELGGRSAATLSYEPAADVDCVGEASQLWALPADLMLPIGPLGPPSFPLRAEAHLVWIIDVDGTRLVIDASAGPDPTPELRAEVQSIVDSIGFGSLTQRIAVGS